MTFLNFGMDNPLTLSMAHPLTERVETIAHKNVRASVSRSAVSAIILGGALISAPLTLASDKTPEQSSAPQSEELAGAADSVQDISVVKGKVVFSTDDNGDNIQIFRIDENGNKVETNLSEFDELMSEAIGELNVLSNLKGLDSLKELEGMKVIIKNTDNIDALSNGNINDIIAKAHAGLDVEGFENTFNFSQSGSDEFSGTNQAYVDRQEALTQNESSEARLSQVKIIVHEASEIQLKSLMDGAAHMVESAQKASQSKQNSDLDLSRVERELTKALKALKKADEALAEEKVK